MQITVAAVGRAKHKPEAELIAHYLKQTRWDITIKEIPDAPDTMAADARRAKEAEGFKKLLTPQSRLFVMDSTGTSLSSPEFARLIQDAQGASIKHTVFAIGGQDGLDPSLIKSAHRCIAFGAATWPHQLLRAMLMEQLYRAYTITIGHPYHLGH
ncbi:MAG: 23S rRNA (pseudouridine(1915)-N(3))-methyltransferase RlmH [Rickettsiales bacterium]